MFAVFAGIWDMSYMSMWRTCRIRHLGQLKIPNDKKIAVSSKDMFWTPKEDTVLNGILMQVYFPAWPGPL